MTPRGPTTRPQAAHLEPWPQTPAYLEPTPMLCNVNRDALRGYLMDDPLPLGHVGLLTKWFSDGLMVYLQTPYELAPPYYMQ